MDKFTQAGGDPAALRSLSRRLREKQAEIDQIRESIKEKTQQLKVAERQRHALITQIHNLRSDVEGPLLTEHAVLRYFERVLGFDMQRVRSRILKDHTIDQIETLGSGHFPVEGGRLVVRKGTIVTVLNSQRELTDEDRKAIIKELWSSQSNGN